ncbi:MAG: protein kinase domain-containing protein [Myxococcota bacterium]
MDVACRRCASFNVPHARYCVQCGAPLLPQTTGADPYVGRVLAGRFHVLRLLAEGAMGRVYLADQRLGSAARFVALKVLRVDAARSTNRAARFHRECQVLVSLTHPNTIRVHDFGELSDGSLFIATEYVSGRSLAESLRTDGPFDPERVERVVTQVAGALAEAHARGIVHRDLKPENVMLSQEPHPDFVKVLDFGIAKRVVSLPHEAPLTARGTVVGTPAYMSPEQFTGQAVTPSSDVYSLAVLTYEMISGALPFRASTPGEWASRHFTAQPKPLEDHPAGRRAPERHHRALAHALAKSPEERPADVWAFVRELTAAEPFHVSWLPAPPSGDAAPASPVPAPVEGDGELQRVHGLRRGPSAVLAALAVGMLFSMAAGVLFLSRRSVQPPPLPEELEWATVGSVAVDAVLGSDDAGAASDASPGWFRSVRSVRGAANPDRAVGGSDGRHAVLAPRGELTVDLGAGRAFRTDGTGQPDLVLVVADESGPYDVQVGADRRSLRKVTRVDRGPATLDLDGSVDHDELLRMVRIASRSRGALKLDAVRALHVVEGSHASNE